MPKEQIQSLQKYTDKKLAYYKESSKTALKVLDAQIKLADKVSLRKHKETIEAYRVECAAINAQKKIVIAECDARVKEADINAKKEVKIVKAILDSDDKQHKLDKQCEILEKMMEVALEAYNKKIEYYDSVSQRAQDFFEPQMKSIDEDINNLLALQEESTDNPKLMFYITKQIQGLRDTRNEINTQYKSLQSDLIKATELAKLEAPGQKTISGFTSNVGLIS